MAAGAGAAGVGSTDSVVGPGLGRLAANSCPTRTLALLKRSAAIEEAGPARCDTATGQRGVKRPQGGTCDIGAFEKS